MFEALRVRVPELFILGAKGAELRELGSPNAALLPEPTTWRRGFGLAGRRSIVEPPIVEEVINHGSANVHCPHAYGGSSPRLSQPRCRRRGKYDGLGISDALAPATP